MLETFAREADLAMGGALAGVYLADGSGGGVATAGHNVDPSWTGIVLSRGEGVAGRVLTTGKPFVTNAYRTEIETAHESLGAIQTAAGVPMVWNGELKGALSVGISPRSAPRTCPRRAAPRPAPTPSCRCCWPGARTG